MTPSEFTAKWRQAELSERSASQQHFLDLCALVEHPAPADVDPTGDTFTFEKGAAKAGGGEGWADVWKKGFFAWEYKGKRKNLAAAYEQLLRYREDLENPPLLVVCDMDRFSIHTNFTATPTVVHEFGLDDLADPANLDKLRAVFHAPDRLRPGVTSERITADAAGHLADLAEKLRTRGHDPQAVARFLDRIVFCLFAEDIGLLPEHLFSNLIEKTRTEPARFSKYVGDLFSAMAAGGDFLLQNIRHFNGNLFTDGAVLELGTAELAIIEDVSRLDWSAIDASIFGTLFERGMDPAKRSQLGVHHTGRHDIAALVEPVVMRPLRREWQEIRNVVGSLLATGRKPKAGESAADWAGLPALTGPRLRKARGECASLVHQFLDRLARLTVLDPACGSGNFLYVTLQMLKDLEKEVILFAMDNGLGSFLPAVGPWQLYGIEINPYAFDLAQMTVWIGYLQWTRANGFGVTQDPVLRPMAANFQCKDAILDLGDPENPCEPAWPRVDCIVGNPPFLGGKLLRRELGDVYVDRLFALWRERVPRESDLCCYWFEKARAHIEAGGCRRAGLLATQGIRGGANREVLRRIKETGDIFFAESDRPWILDGANVHVSMVGFDDGTELQRTLDGRAVPAVNPNLTGTADTATALALLENCGVSFQGPSPKAAFDIDFAVAVGLLTRGGNPDGRPNSDVVRPLVSAVDLVGEGRQLWTIDFGTLPGEQAVLYEEPFAYVREHVYPVRSQNRRASYAEKWWQYAEARPGMRRRLHGLSLYLATPCHSKHRLFRRIGAEVLCNQATIVFARSDDYFFGVLHSRLHEVWALKLGTRLETRPRYTPTTCFETFPLPWAPGQEPADDPRVLAIAGAAKELNELRENWLNPPEWTRTEVLEFPGTVGGPWSRYIDAATVHEVNVPGGGTISVGTVKYPRTVPRDEAAAKLLAKRTLTNLYNQRPAWLDNIHRRLDAAVFAAYGWDFGMTDEKILESLLALNLERAGCQAPKTPTP